MTFGSTFYEIAKAHQRFLSAYPNLSLGLLAYTPRYIEAHFFKETEIIDANYARQSVGQMDGNRWLIDESAGKLVLNQTIVFPQLAGMTSVCGFGLFDEVTSGNLLKWCGIICSTYKAGAILQINSGDFALSASSNYEWHADKGYFDGADVRGCENGRTRLTYSENYDYNGTF